MQSEKATPVWTRYPKKTPEFNAHVQIFHYPQKAGVPTGYLKNTELFTGISILRWH